MDTHNPEFSVLPPEYVPKPELEYAALRAPEQPPLPPEFGQLGYTAEPAAKKRRGLRELLALPAILLLGFLCLHPLKAASAPAEPSKPADTSSSPSSTPLPANTDELEPGTVVFQVNYAVLRGDTVEYNYVVYSQPQDPADEWPETPYPISVYATVTDSGGNAAEPAVNPEVWIGSRDEPFFTVDAAGLSGDLTLTLTALYTENGEDRQTVGAYPVDVLPPEPETTAYFHLIDDGTSDFKAELIPAAGYEDAYDLELLGFGFTYYAEGHAFYGSTASFDDMPELTRGEDGVWLAHLMTESGVEYLPEEVKEIGAMVTLRDKKTGYIYRIESDAQEVPRETVPELAVYPLGSEHIIITVYNDTITFDIPTVIENDDYMTILDQQVYTADTFTGYTLPDAIAPSGYTFNGWVVHSGSPFDNGFDGENPFKAYSEQGIEPPASAVIGENPIVFNVGNTLTPEDISHVPISADGTRYVNVHACWYDPSNTTAFILLDDGMGNVASYNADHPLVSEGFIYLCSFPVPEREGYAFAGWYDLFGNRVEVLNAYYSFIPEIYDDNGNFVDHNWDVGAMPVYLTAHWIKQ